MGSRGFGFRGLGVQGIGVLGFRGLGVQGSGFRGSGYRGFQFRGSGVQGLGFRGLGYRGFGVLGLGLGVWGLGVQERTAFKDMRPRVGDWSMMCLRVVCSLGGTGLLSACQVIMQILKLVVILAAGPVHHVGSSLD